MDCPDTQQISAERVHLKNCTPLVVGFAHIKEVKHLVFRYVVIHPGREVFFFFVVVSIQPTFPTFIKTAIFLAVCVVPYK